MLSEVRAENIEVPEPRASEPVAAMPVGEPSAPGIALRMRVKRSLQTLVGFGYDMARFARYSTTVRAETDAESLDAHIMMDFHRIEKGLALPKPTPGFGNEVVQRLIRNVTYGEARYGCSHASTAARSALGHYREHALKHGVQVAEVERFLAAHPYTPGAGGTLTVTRADVQSKAKRDLDEFFFSRFSVRQFTGEPVAEELLLRAVRVAIKTPSVCNRQAARAHALVDRAQIDKALAIQGGNRGFGHLVGALMVVTVDMRKFVSSAERYQGWIDGGLFAMSLCYGFHALGLGTCMLNWSVNPRIDLRLREAVSLPAAENVIVMMAVGHLPEEFAVAMSPRREPASVLTIHR
jgi:nitroreductase